MDFTLKANGKIAVHVDAAFTIEDKIASFVAMFQDEKKEHLIGTMRITWTKLDGHGFFPEHTRLTVNPGPITFASVAVRNKMSALVSTLIKPVLLDDRVFQLFVNNAVSKIMIVKSAERGESQLATNLVTCALFGIVLEEGDSACR